MISLNDRRVLVVGGTSGIGLAVAHLAAGQSARVTIAGRSPERLSAALGTLPGAKGLQFDIGDDTTVTEMLAPLQPFDHVVVSAGSVAPASFRGNPVTSAMSGFNTKLWGAWRVAAQAPLASDASITFISGVFAERPSAKNVAASCVNAALEALARALAVELGPVRVNAVSPGLVDTPMWSAMPEERRTAYFASVAEKLPARRICADEDVAALVIACMTNPSLTGAVLKVDGGYSPRKSRSRSGPYRRHRHAD